MSAIVAYGSLLNQKQSGLRSHLLTIVCPVTVKGYRRIFNQEPTWRKGNDRRRAVLSIVQSDSDHFNGLLLALTDNDNFSELDERERGYDRVLVPHACIAYSANTHYLSESKFSFKQTFVYIGKPEKKNDSILPNEDYLHLCLRGAKQWGEEFYEQFLQTTYIGSLNLKTFLAGQRLTTKRLTTKRDTAE